jgi:hypothetical protein
MWSQGHPFLFRTRSNAQQPIADIFFKLGQEIQELEKYQPDIKQHPGLMKGHVPALGEVIAGALTLWNAGKEQSRILSSLHKKKFNSREKSSTRREF